MMKIVFLILTLYTSVSAQVNTEWTARFNRSGANADDLSASSVLDNAGNIYIAGYSQDSLGYVDCAVVKYNSSGVMQWARHYSGQASENDYLSDISVDSAGNVYAVGHSWTDNNAKYDCLTLKYNSSGVLQWAAKYNGGNFNDEGKSIAVDSGGNVYVTGKSDTLEFYSSTIITIKYNSSGVMQWAVRYPAAAGNDNCAFSIALDNSSNVYITGRNAFSTGNFDYVTVKYNTSGIKQWAASYNGPGNSFDLPKYLALDPMGNVYVTGESSAGNGSDCVTLKYNSSGVLQWTGIYNSPSGGNDAGYSMAIDNSGNILIAGSTITGVADDMLTLKYSPAGTLQWARTFNGTANGYDIANSVTADAAGNVYVSGYTHVDSTTDYTTIKYNPAGVQQWVKHFEGGINSYDRATAIQIDAFNNIIVTGNSAGTGTGSDIAVVKYSQIVGLTHTSGETPESFSLSQNYPNPFNPFTVISFSTPKAGFVKLSVYDILGREVSIPVNEYLSPGSYSYNFDAANLASGIYFYALSSAGFHERRKMLLIK